MDQPLEITPAGRLQRDQALQLLFGHYKRPERQGVIASLLQSTAAGIEPSTGLLVARREEQLVGVVWVQRQQGRTAAVWPPVLVPGEPESTALRLLEAGCSGLSEGEATLVQALIAPEDQQQRERLLAAGFEQLAKLEYLAALRKGFLRTPSHAELEFEPFQPDQLDRLAGLIQGTYQGTLDCPRLNGVRPMEDVLTGYCTTGSSASELWYFVRTGGRDVGTLLLAEHADADQAELVYMGLLPEARGAGFGSHIARQAQQIAEERGLGRVVLAVDAANHPALRAYAAAGFFSWAKRTALIRILTQAKR